LCAHFSRRSISDRSFFSNLGLRVGCPPGPMESIPMISRSSRVLFPLWLLLLAAACTKSSPTQPSGSASVTTPRPLLPINGAQVRNADQPVVLSVQNAIATGGGTTYTFEVAGDAGFAIKVQTKDNVSEASGGQTAVRLDALAPARDYYWRARAQSSSTAGIFG